MGANAGRPEPRVPQLKDLLSLCRALNGAGARYVIVGGFAVILHGYARGTMDLDLLIDPSPENVRKIKVALAVLPDNAVAEVTARMRSSGVKSLMGLYFESTTVVCLLPSRRA